MNQNLAVCIEGLVKTDSSGRRLVDDLSFSLPQGQVMGLVGINGAGKTTTFKCLLGLIDCKYRRLEIYGHSVADALTQRLVGWVPEKPILFNGLNAIDHCRLVEPKATPAQIKNALDRVDLTERAERKTVHQFSKGMRQRLALALALIRMPKLLILDEPFSGLDFLGRDEVRHILLDIKKTGTTVILSSHHTYDLTVLCDVFCLLHKGRVIQQKPLTSRAPEELEREFLDAIRDAKS